MNPLTANQQDRIADLQPYLIRVAQNIVSTHYPDQSPDELLQVMNLTLCEQAAQDPAFLEQTRAYIVTKAAWAARDHCRREQYGQNLAPVSLEAETDDGASIAETLPAPLADLDLPVDLARALAGLDEKRRQIAAMLAGDVPRKEIAARFGVRSPSLSWDLGKIRAALQPVATARGL